MFCSLSVCSLVVCVTYNDVSFAVCGLVSWVLYAVGPVVPVTCDCVLYVVCDCVTEPSEMIPAADCWQLWLNASSAGSGSCPPHPHLSRGNVNNTMNAIIAYLLKPSDRSRHSARVEVSSPDV